MTELMIISYSRTEGNISFWHQVFESITCSEKKMILIVEYGVSIQMLWSLVGAVLQLDAVGTEPADSGARVSARGRVGGGTEVKWGRRWRGEGGQQGHWKGGGGARL